MNSYEQQRVTIYNLLTMHGTHQLLRRSLDWVRYGN